jgi:HlyD family secretion protein
MAKINRRRVRTACLLVSAAAAVTPLIIGSAACLKGVSTQTVKKEKISILQVTKGFFKETLAVTGKILPANIVYLDAVEGGRVEKIFVEAGSIVKSGDKILELANTNLLLDIMLRESELSQQSDNLRNMRLAVEQFKLQLNQQLSEIENRLQQQKRVYERYKELEKDGLISEHEYELAKDQYEYLLKQKDMTLESQKSELKIRQSQADAAEENVKRLQANLDVAKQRQENLTIAAPVSGQLTSLNAEVGESKSPGERLGQIDQWDGFKVRASIDERFIASVKIKDPGEFEFSGQTYKVDVKKVYPEVKDEKFEVDFEFLGEHPVELRRGQTLHIKLALEDPNEVILLPRGDFFGFTGGKWIYVLDETGKNASKKRIRIGRQTADTLEVREGLKEGDRVVVSSYESFENCERLILK